MFIDDLILRNRAFVQSKVPEPWPKAEACSLAVLACYDPRLDKLLRPALGLGPGQGFMLRTSGATAGDDVLRALAVAIYLFEVRNILVVGHERCRMADFPTADFIDAFRRRGVDRQAFGESDLRSWVRATANPRQGVLSSITEIWNAAFLPADLSLAGAVLDEETGKLDFVHRPGDRIREGARSTSKNAVKASRGGDRVGAIEIAAPATIPASPTPPLPPSAPRAKEGESSVPAELHPAFMTLGRGLGALADQTGPRQMVRLKQALEKESSILRQLVLILQFLKGSDADDLEVRQAIEYLTREISSSRQKLPRRALIDLIKSLGGKQGGR